MQPPFRKLINSNTNKLAKQLSKKNLKGKNRNKGDQVVRKRQDLKK